MKKVASPVVGITATPVFAIADVLTDALCHICDEYKLVCSISVDIRGEDGRRVLAIDAHGKREVLTLSPPPKPRRKK